MTKKLLIVLFWFIAVTIQVNAQRASYKDSIEVVGNYFTGLKFYQHDQKIPLRLLGAVMHGNEEAMKYLNRAKTNNTFGVITGFIGGLLVGYELGTLLGGQDINWGVMSVGAGFIVISIPFDTWFRKNARKAVYEYNSAYR